jgi:hypothetical protein
MKRQEAPVAERCMAASPGKKKNLKVQAETKTKRKREQRKSSSSTQRSSVHAEVPIYANLVYRCESASFCAQHDEGVDRHRRRGPSLG